MACMGIALVFWLLIKLSQTYRAEKQVGFDIELPDHKTLAHLPPADFVASLEGTGWDLLLDHFRARRLTLTYDMQETNQLALGRGQLRTDIKARLYSNDIRIIEVNYDNLNLVAEPLAQKKVPVQLRQQLSFAPEHQLKGNILLTPDSVLLTGPKSLIEQYGSWPTDSLVLSGLEQSQARSLPLARPPVEVSCSPGTVTAEIEVEPFTEKSVYVPLVVRNAPDSLRVFPDKVTVTCKIGLSYYDQINSSGFLAEIDLKGVALNSAGNTIPIRLTRKPAFALSVYFTPKSAKFFFVEPADTLSLPAQPSE